MSKVQARQVELARHYVRLGHPEIAARSISACIRCSLRQREIEELRAVARELGVDRHPEFIA